VAIIATEIVGLEVSFVLTAVESRAFVVQSGIVEIGFERDGL